MSWSRKRLKEASLYLILDAQVLSYKELLAQLKSAVRFGVDIVQLRDKNATAKDILDFCRQIKQVTDKKCLFIVNDRIDVAMLAGADGVHLGQEDIAYADARRMMGSKAIIGVSCQDKAHARVAQAQGVDYIGFGSVFKTQTKPHRQPMNLKLVKRIVQEINVPTFFIGGINLNNLGLLKDLGVKRIAVCRDILLAKDVGRAVQEFKGTLS